MSFSHLQLEGSPRRHRGVWLGVSAAIWLLVLTLAGAACLPATAAVAPPRVATAAPVAAVDQDFAIADFDGDSEPDTATVEMGQISASRARYWILFEMSAGPRQSIGVTAPVGGVEIAPRDVNGDRSLDLIVTTAWLNEPVAILLNDGHGNFTLREARTFPESVSRCGPLLRQPNVESRDFAAVLTRVSGDCESDPALSGIPESLERVDPAAVAAATPSLSAFALGRAPPSIVAAV